MKLCKKNFFLYIGFISAFVLFLFAAAPGQEKPAPAQATQGTQEKPQSAQQRRFLLANYRVLADFLKLPDYLFTRTTPTDLLQIKDPFIAGVIKLRIAAELLEEKKYSQAEDLIYSLGNPPGFLENRIAGLTLETLYLQQRYARFIRCYEAAPAALKDNLHNQILYLNCLCKSEFGENPARAGLIFKKLFLNNHLKPFKDLMSAADLQRLMQKLSYDDWLQKFSYLAERNYFSEFLREKQYVNSIQLVNLFYAEFYYKKKQYKKAEQYLCAVNSLKLQPYKQKILIKIELRRDNYQGLAANLEKLKNDQALYAQTMLDAAGILLIQHETILSLELFEKYIALIEENGREKSPGKTINNPDYWRANWCAAWLHYRKNHMEKALPYFEKGLQADAVSYKIANTYWYHRLKKAVPSPTLNTIAKLSRVSPMEEYPFTYYYAKLYDKQTGPMINDYGLKRFTALINGEQGPLFLELISQLKLLLVNGLIDEGLDFVQWAKNEQRLTVSEKNTFKILESIFYLKKKDFFHTFIAFRNNFDNYPALRLPKFLKEIYCPVRFENFVYRYSNQYKLDKHLVLALIREESFFNPTIVSPARANGLMQLLFSTARGVSKKMGIRLKKWDLYNPELNIRLGNDYLKSLMDRYDNKIHLALAAYNAGENRVDEWLQLFGQVQEDEFIEMIPFTETRNYVKNILRNYYYYKFYYGKSVDK